MLIDLCARYHIWRGSKLSEVMTKKCPIMNTQYSGSAVYLSFSICGRLVTLHELYPISTLLGFCYYI